MYLTISFSGFIDYFNLFFVYCSVWVFIVEFDWLFELNCRKDTHGVFSEPVDPNEVLIMEIRCDDCVLN